MAITYYFRPNSITPDPNDQVARILFNKSSNEDKIIQKMLKRGTMSTKSDIKAILELFYEVVIDEMVEGNPLNIPILQSRPTIKGVFTSAADSFDRSRHVVTTSLSPGTLVTKRMAEAELAKTTKVAPAPVLIQFVDSNTNIANANITPNGIGELVGENLKFDKDNPDEGIFFIAEDSTETKVSIVPKRFNGQLLFSIPALTPGNYTLEVRRAYTKNKTIRKGDLGIVLVVS